MIGSAPVCKGEVLSYGDYVDQLRERLKKAHTVAHKNIGKSAVKQKDRYDVKVYQTLYEVGDYIWYLAETCRHGRCLKLNRDFEGPYVITKKLNPLDFQIQVDTFGTSKQVHHDKILLQHGPSNRPIGLKEIHILKQHTHIITCMKINRILC